MMRPLMELVKDQTHNPNGVGNTLTGVEVGFPNEYSSWENYRYGPLLYPNGCGLAGVVAFDLCGVS